MKNLFENLKDTFKKEDFNTDDNKAPKKGIFCGLKRLPGVYMIPVERLKLSEFSLRNIEDDEGLESLAQSIKEDKMLHPLTVRYILNADCYEIITGKRRYYSAKKIGLKEVPCIIENEEIDDEKVILRILVENLMREDLDPMDEAAGFKLLIDRFGYNQIKLAEKFGRSKAYISQILSISKIPGELKKKVHTCELFDKGKLIEVAKQKEPEKMTEMVEEIKDKNLSVPETRKLSKKIRNAKPSQTNNFDIALKKCKEFLKATELLQPEELEKKEMKEIIAVVKSAVLNMKNALKTNN